MGQMTGNSGSGGYGGGWNSQQAAPMTPGSGTYDQNMQAAAGSVPGAPGWIGQQLGWYSNTPQNSNPASYGRWNWLNSGGTGGGTGGGGMPSYAAPAANPAAQPTAQPQAAPAAPAQGAQPAAGLTPEWQSAMNNIKRGYNNPQPAGGAVNPAFQNVDNYQHMYQGYMRNLGANPTSTMVNNYGTSFANQADADAYGRLMALIHPQAAGSSNGAP